MEITRLQKDAIKINTKNAQIVINAKTDQKADIGLYSSPTESPTQDKTFTGPGEYEVQGCMIDGIALGAGNTSYSVLAEGIHVYYAREVADTFSDDQLERIDGVDVLILHAHEGKAELMNKLISQVEPKVVIPLTQEDSELKVLADEFGTKTDTVEKYKVSKKDLPVDSQQLVILK